MRSVVNVFIAVVAIVILLWQITFGALGFRDHGEYSVVLSHGNYAFSPSVGCSFGEIDFSFYVLEDMDRPLPKWEPAFEVVHNMDRGRRRWNLEWWRILRIETHTDSRYRRLDAGFIFADFTWFGLCLLEGIAIVLWFRRQYRKRQQRRRGFLVGDGEGVADGEGVGSL